MLRHAFSSGLFLVTAFLATVCLVCTPVLAQSFGRGGTGAGGMGAGRAGGSAFGGGAGGATGATGGFGAGGFGGAAFGGGGFGGQTGAAGGVGGSAFGGGAASMSGFATQGGNQFLTGNQANAGFVGRDAAAAQQFFGGTQGGQFGQQQAFQNQARREQFRMQNQANRDNRGRGRGQRGDQATPVRVSLRVGFAPPRPPTAGLNGRLQNEVSRTLSSRLGVTNPTIDLAGQTAILRGTVASEEQKLLAEQILSLQPGVTTVTNELAVVPELPEPLEE